MRLGLVASVRDEAPYLVEWVAHHRALGFGPILIYQNDSRDGTGELLAAMAAQGLIGWHDNSARRTYRRARLRHQPPVIRALMRAQASGLAESCDYVLVCDVDEFLVVYGDTGAAALIERLGHPDAVSFAWRVFGDNGRDTFDPSPVAERFTRAAGADDPGVARPYWQVKTLFRPARTTLWKQHRPRFDGAPVNWRDAAGRDIADRMRQGHVLDPPALEQAAMHHYHCKSRAEFHLKIMRGYGCLTPKRRVRPGLGTRTAMNANAVPCPMPDALRKARIREMARIRALPGIARAEAAALARFGVLLERADRAVRADPARWQAGFLADSDTMRDRAERILAGED
ncbi:MAG: glycosyltransferase family 2 protein [Jhaorihella sp.]